MGELGRKLDLFILERAVRSVTRQLDLASLMAIFKQVREGEATDTMVISAGMVTQTFLKIYSDRIPAELRQYIEG